MKAILLVASVIGFFFGALAIMAGAMSDNPYAGDRSAKGGFITCVICIVMFVLAFVATHNGWIQ